MRKVSPRDETLLSPTYDSVVIVIASAGDESRVHSVYGAERQRRNLN